LIRLSNPTTAHSVFTRSISDYTPLVNLISLLFQIRDDYLNLQSTEYGDNKGYCEDLSEGKFSFPLIHGVRWEMEVGKREILSESVLSDIHLSVIADTLRHAYADVLQKKTTDHSLKAYTVSILKHRTGSFKYTRGVMKTLSIQVMEEIRRLGGNEVLECIVKGLEVQVED
jgi:geranylgeranyl diphosphate synthase type 3